MGGGDKTCRGAELASAHGICPVPAGENLTLSCAWLERLPPSHSCAPLPSPPHDTIFCSSVLVKHQRQSSARKALACGDHPPVWTPRFRRRSRGARSFSSLTTMSTMWVNGCTSTPAARWGILLCPSSVAILALHVYACLYSNLQVPTPYKSQARHAKMLLVCSACEPSGCRCRCSRPSCPCRSFLHMWARTPQTPTAPSTRSTTRT